MVRNIPQSTRDKRFLGTNMIKLKVQSIFKKSLCGLAVCLFITNHAEVPEFRPFRPGVVLIGGIKAAIAGLEHEINRLESEAVGVPTLKEKLGQQNQELANIKNSLGISYLEAQQQSLKGQFDGFAQRFFETAQIDGIFLYNSVSEKIALVINDPEVLQKIRTITRLKREVRDRLTTVVGEVNELGQQINIMTRDNQRGLNTIKSQLAMIQQQLSIKLLSQEAHRQMDPVVEKISDTQQKIDGLLSLRFTDDRLNLIQIYRNRIQQYQLLLDYLRDPSVIPLTTEDKILKFD